MAMSDYGYSILIESGKRVTVDGVKRVIFFSNEKISLLIGRQLFDVIGSNLKLAEIDTQIACITGAIDGVVKNA